MNRRNTFYKITIHHVGKGLDEDSVQHELDLFWTFGPELIDIHHHDEQKGEGNWHVFVKGEEGFDDAWMAENQLDARTTVEAGETPEEVGNGAA